MNKFNKELDPWLQNQLLKAAKIGDIAKMYQLIKQGANPFLLDSNNNTAITYAIAVNPVKTGSLLLELDHLNKE